MKKTLLLITTLALFCACNKNDATKPESWKQFLTKSNGWQLTEVNLLALPSYDPSTLPSYDPSRYTCVESNILFKFSSDGTLMVSQEINGIIDWEQFDRKASDVYQNNKIGGGGHTYDIITDATYVKDFKGGAFDVGKDGSIIFGRIAVSDKNYIISRYVSNESIIKIESDNITYTLTKVK